MPQSLKRCLYHSQLSSRAQLQHVANIAKVGREFTLAHSITGLLVFDGLRFCEYLEGPRQSMQQLMDRIKKDPRHTHFVSLLESDLPGERLFHCWTMAYVLDADAEPVATLAGLTGEAALAHFMSMVPELDIA